MWIAGFQGVGECNFVIEELARLNPNDFGLTRTDFNNFTSQARALRAWFYIQLFDAFRNIPIWTDFSKSLPKDIKQAPPTETFRFIEKELLECLDPIEQKQSLGSQSNVQGRWTKAGVAALLVRLYLNAEAWIGEDRYDDCAKYAQRILDGEYGPYKVEDRWDAVFDWNNDTSDEMIFGFPSSGDIPIGLISRKPTGVPYLITRISISATLNARPVHTIPSSPVRPVTTSTANSTTMS